MLLNCPLYDDLRQAMVDNILMHYGHFNTLDELEKLAVILGSDNYNVIKTCAKTCRDILDRRRGFLYQWSINTYRCVLTCFFCIKCKI